MKKSVQILDGYPCLFVNAPFKGRSGGPDAPLRWYVGVGDDDWSSGYWLSATDARKMARALVRAADYIKRRKELGK